MRWFWDLVQHDATFMRRVNGWLTIFWALMIPVALLSGWMESVIFVSAVSIYANLVGHWSTWQAARVEVKQDIQDEKEPVK
jgi:hypothetical protein